MKHKKKLLFLILFISIFSLAGFVKASVLGFDTSTPCTYWEDVFNFSMSAAGVLTLVMLVLGGLYYIVSLGQEEKLGNAKKMMTGAMAGFLLALFSYLIFQVISPSLLQCRFDIPDVILPEPTRDAGNNGSGTGGGSYDPCAGIPESNLYDTQDYCRVQGGAEGGECEGTCFQSSTFTVTNVDDSDAGVGNTDDSGGDLAGTTDNTPDATGGTNNNYKWCCQRDVGECPITFTSTDNGAGRGRSMEFIENIESHLTTSGRQRIAEVGLAAVACQINFGSCGKTTDVISTTALRGSSAGLACNENWHGGSCVTKSGIGSISGEQRRWMRTISCCTDGSCGPVPECDNSDCTTDSSQAKNTVRERFARELGSDWPNEWVSQLQPGDEIYMYNGNSSCGASHSVTFIGWNDDRGNAITIESGVSTPTQRGVRCLSSRCGQAPIVTMVNRPN